jgi:hypothetical protein
MAYELTQATQVLAIAEQEYGTANEVRFTRFTSCIGLLGVNGPNVTGVHLVAVSNQGTPFDQDVAADAVAALGAFTQVVILGTTNSWGTEPALSVPFAYLVGRLTQNGVPPSVWNFADGIYGGRVDNGTFQIYADGNYFDAD